MSGTIPTGITSMIFESWKQKGKRISENTHTQTHTHTHIYIYIHTYIHTYRKKNKTWKHSQFGEKHEPSSLEPEAYLANPRRTNTTPYTSTLSLGA